MLPSQLSSSPRSITFTAAAQLADADGIKTAIATTNVAAAYSGAALNGAMVTAGNIARPQPNGHVRICQYPYATAAAHAGSYVNGSTITFTGSYNGAAVSRVATVVGTDGGVAFIADGPIDWGGVSAIAVQAQVDALGSWQFGFTDIAARPSSVDGLLLPFRAIRGGAAGVAACVFADGTEDLHPLTAAETNVVEIYRLRAATTTAALTLYE